MKDSNPKISSIQLFSILFVARAVILVTVNTTLMGGMHLIDNVLSCGLALVLNFVLILPLYFLNRFSPDENVLDASYRLLGKAGWITPVIYILYFILMDSHYLSFFELFLSNSMDPLVPLWLVAVAVLGTALYAAFRGIEAVARAALFIMVLIVIGIVFILISLISKVEPINFEPLLYAGPKQMLTGTVLFLSRSTGFATMAILLPNTKGKKKMGFTLWNFGVYGMMAAFILVMVGALGIFVNSQLFPVYAASAYARAGIFEDLDAVFTGIWICGLLIKISVDLCMIGVCAHKLFKGSARKWAMPVSALAVAVLSLLITGVRPLQQLFFGIELLMPATFTVACLFPLVFLIIHLVKKRRARRVKPTKSEA